MKCYREYVVSSEANSNSLHLKEIVDIDSDMWWEIYKDFILELGWSALIED